MSLLLLLWAQVYDAVESLTAAGVSAARPSGGLQSASETASSSWRPSLNTTTLPTAHYDLHVRPQTSTSSTAAAADLLRVYSTYAAATAAATGAHGRHIAPTTAEDNSPSLYQPRPTPAIDDYAQSV